MNLFFFDVETGGLDPSRNPILQIAWIMDIDGVIVREQVYDVLPDPTDEFSIAALDVNAFTLERMRAGRPFSYVAASLKGQFAEHTGVRFMPVGHNVTFDISFIITAFKKSCTYISQIDFKRPLDTRSMAIYAAYQGFLNIENYKLKTLADHFEIPINAHDALSDIRATRSLFYKLHSFLSKDTE